MRMYFQPRTPYAALKAAEARLLPPEAFIYKATSIEPLIDNPEHMEEIERIMGQNNRDIETNLLLLSLLNRMLRDPDKEKALFAAESINAIENSYNRTLESLGPDDFRKRAKLYMELAEINNETPDLRNFYLREAFSALRSIEKNNTAQTEDFLNMSRVLIQLGLLVQAESIIKDKNIKGPDALFILAETAFKKRDYIKLREIIEKLDAYRSMLDINQTSLADFWTGRDE